MTRPLMPAFAIILPKCPVAMIKSNKFPISLRDNRPFVIRGVDCKLGIDSRPILDTGLVQRLKTKSREFPLMVKPGKREFGAQQQYFLRVQSTAIGIVRG